MVDGGNLGGQKVIDVKPVTTRKKTKVVLYLKLFVVFLWLALILLAVDKYYYHHFFKAEAAPVTQVTAVTKPVEAPKVDVKAPVETAPKVEEAAKADEGLSVAIASINKRLDNLAGQNKALLTYFAARDLRDSLGDNDAFKTQLQFFSETVEDDANLNGKIDILQQSTATGLVTKAKLQADLKVLEKNIANASDGSFSGSIKSAFGNLVKVSKIEGDVSATDYNSILKRAELTLAKPNLSAVELQNMINDVAKLGKATDGFVKEANNLQRVLEVTDFLVTYTKAKAIKTNSADD